MLRIIAIDDEPLVLENLKYVISQLEQAELIGAFTDPRQVLHDYPDLRPDAVLVDINMPTMNGLDFAEQLHELDSNAQIIFLTAYDSYALDAYHVSALDYLMKPSRRPSCAKPCSAFTPVRALPRRPAAP